MMHDMIRARTRYFIVDWRRVIMQEPGVAGVVWLIWVSKAMLLGFLFALAVLVVLRLLSGAIRTGGMLAAREGGPPSPERVQLLVVSLAGMGSFVALAFQQHAIPDPPDWMLGAFILSNLGYVSGKSIRRFLT